MFMYTPFHRKKSDSPADDPHPTTPNSPTTAVLLLLSRINTRNHPGPEFMAELVKSDGVVLECCLEGVEVQ